MDAGLMALCDRSFSLSLAAIGVPPRARLDCRDGKVTAWFGEEPAGSPKGAAGGMLLFSSARACARSLAGGRGLVLPLPFGAAFPRALQFFRTAASRSPELLRSPEVASFAKARLLLAASMYGIAAVAGDPYLAKRMGHFPDGIVQIGSGETIFLLEKKGRAIRVLGGESSAHATDGVTAAIHKPDAILSFSSPESAIAVLSGKRQAVVALGSGEVTIAGLLPLVQGLFAVLDRLSWYLGVVIGEGKK